MVAYDHSKKTTNSSAGVPLFGTPFEQVEPLAQRTRVARRLNKESRQPESQRSKATRVIRLMEKGEVDGNHWKEVCGHLSGNLNAEAMRSCLGQFSSSNRNLSALPNCADTHGIRNILNLGESGCPCHFCAGGPDSRVHWCHEGPAWQPAFVHGLDSISAPCVRGQQPVVSPRSSVGFRRSRLQNDQ